MDAGGFRRGRDRFEGGFEVIGNENSKADGR
jgi:hypothetical protein